MMPFRCISARSYALPLAADDIIEFHVARLLLLIDVCGTAGRIDGLTKMAKLDFFARYPDFFDAATGRAEESSHREAVESAMVRYHYGPWDKRYYHVLSHLEGKQLIRVTKRGVTFCLELTSLGKEVARKLRESHEFEPLVSRMRQIKKQFGQKTGSALKDLIYKTFDREVGDREMGEVIRHA